ncbi:MAG TPA: protein kinase, partial [Vicinamibacteria bacterium]
MAEDDPTSTGVPLAQTVGPTVTRLGGGLADLDMDVPERIGPYRITGVLGSGGMGVVFRAEQTEPVQREVALKIIKLGMDTKEVVTRFEAERQALALMDHPNIARVYEAGATEAGRPYFAMELVRGVPLTK